MYIYTRVHFQEALIFSFCAKQNLEQWQHHLILMLQVQLSPCWGLHQAPNAASHQLLSLAL